LSGSLRVGVMTEEGRTMISLSWVLFLMIVVVFVALAVLDGYIPSR
jgi:hypothetical protein